MGVLTTDVAAIVDVLEREAAADPSPPSLALRRSRHELQVSRFTPHGTRAPVATVEDHQVAGPASSVPIRIYRPTESTAATLPTVLWMHGGGWTTGSLETADVLAREVCNAGTVVVSVDYRLAPEAPFPAGLEDCCAVFHWLVHHIEQLGGDPGQVAVGGDSAGGNLAAVVAQRAVSMNIDLAGQLLIYPVVDAGLEHTRYPSRAANRAGPVLALADLEWIVGQYVEPGVDLKHRRISPIFADHLVGLAPAVIVTVELDPLRDEGRAYARRLVDAGVTVRAHDVPGLPHGVFDMLEAVPLARETARSATADLLSLIRGGKGDR